MCGRASIRRRHDFAPLHFRGGELQIIASAVNIKRFAQVLGTHGTAFEVPAGNPTDHGLFQTIRS
jgi:hypothetical protein